MIEKLENEKFDGIFKGEEIASVLSNEYLKTLIDEHNISDSIEEIIKGDSNMIEVVVFKINDEEFAFDINNVQEIIKYEKATFFPQAPSFVEGLLNLRGNVIPIISLPKKLGFEEKITDKTKIIVCNVESEKVGFVVDDVSDIMFIEDDKISKVENEESLFDEVINLDDRVVFKVDINQIFTDEEIKAIKLTKVNNG
jgi:purine-binding chemotaxis protein CheW